MALFAFLRIVCNIERVFARFAANRLFLVPCIPGSRHAFGCVIL